ncbi:Vac7p NDAI_0D01090 [Naumovozyma dairenensis CBS 421]|uniref:Vacuolar segregation protein 7 n=1 Tax=Naumovozyma dairenensis (strain ATCC 10597 / BCRC 20456 / CBS 421 / NBRC 0211 / NRRL Y-12639) TaxID=1071378 RepID=G0W9G1_NAUDC|nr:hypothetical protein NDAI_0D01090 [Naumovozyma dairenensis CBS 421]CCD24422.1 hypothetical protein NDAI_0D01090 [Naumovozyma dairenensis CBS 421]
MNADDLKFTVETETVETPALDLPIPLNNNPSTLLLSNKNEQQQQQQQQQQQPQQSVHRELSHTEILNNSHKNNSSPSSKVRPEIVSSTQQMQRPSPLSNIIIDGSTHDNIDSLMRSSSTIGRSSERVHVDNDTNINNKSLKNREFTDEIREPNHLIDNNPLSSHLSHQPLKNKKSSLLVGSSYGLPSMTTDISRIDSTKGTLGNNAKPRAPMAEIHNSGNDRNTNNAIRENHTSLSNANLISRSESVTSMSQPNKLTASLLPEKSSIHSGPNSNAMGTKIVSSAKIIDRPSLPLRNSRELLLSATVKADGSDHSSLAIDNGVRHEASITAGSEIKLKKDTDNLGSVSIRKTVSQDKGIEPNEIIETQQHDVSQKPTKTDFFAAKLASAVGDNEVSDSEETFVYESAANSTKNAIFPNSNGELLAHQQQQQVSENRSHGITPKMSVPILNNNKKLLSRLKNTRHISTGGIPTTSLAALAPLNAQNVEYDHSGIVQAQPHSVLQNPLKAGANSNNQDDLESFTSYERQQQQTNRTKIDRQSINSYNLEQQQLLERSPNRRLNGSVSTTDGLVMPSSSFLPQATGMISSPSIPRRNMNGNTNNNYSMNNINNSDNTNTTNNNNNNNNNNNIQSKTYGTSMNATLSNPTQRKSSITRHTANLPKQQEGISASGSKRKLRTTVSKIFDADGAPPLRRYSGVPDNVNLEDYIEQSDEYHIPNSIKMNSYIAPKGTQIGQDEYRRSSTHTYTSDYDYNNNIKPSNNMNANSNGNGNFFNEPGAIKEENEEDLSINSNKKESMNFNHPNNNSNLEQMLDDDDEMVPDDDRSMFYYSHRDDLEARPHIADYRNDFVDDEEDVGEDHDPLSHNNHVNNQNHPLYYDNGYTTEINNGRRSFKHTSYYDPTLSPTFFQHQQLPQQHNLTLTGAQSQHNAGFLATHPQQQQQQLQPNINENTPLRPKNRPARNGFSYSPHNFNTKKSSWSKIKNCVYFTFVVISLLTVGFILGFLLATNKELQGIDIVVMDNIISSSDELVFDVTVSAFNPGFFSITIRDIDIDVFARSSFINKEYYVDGKSSGNNNKNMETTILLGTIYSLETPLQFQGGFFNRNYDVSRSSIKILHPGSNDAKHNGGSGGNDEDDNDDRDKQGAKQEKGLSISRNGWFAGGDDNDDDHDDHDDSKKWKTLIQHDYELIIRGNMKYRIPFFNNEKSVAVQKSEEVPLKTKRMGMQT